MASLRKGDMVRVVHYENGAYEQTIGAVSEVLAAYRTLRVVRKPIAFDDVWEVEGIGQLHF